MNHFMDYSDSKDLVSQLERNIKKQALSLLREECRETCYLLDAGVSNIAVQTKMHDSMLETDSYISKLMVQLHLTAFLYPEMTMTVSRNLCNSNKIFVGPTPADLDQELLKDLIRSYSPDKKEDRKLLVIAAPLQQAAFLEGIAPLEDIKMVLLGDCNAHYEVFADLFTTLLYMKFSNAGYYYSIREISQIFGGGFSESRIRKIQKLSDIYGKFYKIQKLSDIYGKFYQ